MSGSDVDFEDRNATAKCLVRMLLWALRETRDLTHDAEAEAHIMAAAERIHMQFDFDVDDLFAFQPARWQAEAPARRSDKFSRPLKSLPDAAGLDRKLVQR